jgi:hypothetical protein
LGGTDENHEDRTVRVSTKTRTEYSKVKFSPYLTNKHYAMKTYGGSESRDPRFLDLGSSWKSVISFTLQPLYPQGKSPRYPLDRGLCGPKKGFWMICTSENSDTTGSRTPVLRFFSPWPIALPTELSRLLNRALIRVEPVQPGNVSFDIFGLVKREWSCIANKTYPGSISSRGTTLLL